MGFKELLNKRLNIEDTRDAPKALMGILFDKAKREELFNELLDYQNNDLDYDWFFDYFQEEHGERKKLKQDFTPKGVTKVVSGLTGKGDGESVYDATAGTGTLFIAKWVENGRNKSDWYRLDELSSRTIPFLLFNMAIRGINGVLVHGDSLNQEAEGVIAVRNSGKFSDIDIMPYGEDVEKEYNIKFIKKTYLDKVGFTTRIITLYRELNKKREMEDVTDKYKTISDVLQDYKLVTVSDREKIIDIIVGGESLKGIDIKTKVKEVMDLDGKDAVARIII